MDNLILISISIILPLVLVIANKLIDRTEAKKKDKTIEDLKTRLVDAMAQNMKVGKEKQLVENVSESVVEVAKVKSENIEKRSELMNEARNTMTLDDALAVARRQVEESRK